MSLPSHIREPAAVDDMNDTCQSYNMLFSRSNIDQYFRGCAQYIGNIIHILSRDLATGLHLWLTW